MGSRISHKPIPTLLDAVTTDEIVLEVPAEACISLLSYLSHMKIHCVATNLLLSPCAERSSKHVWVDDVGNRVRTALMARLFLPRVQQRTNQGVYSKGKSKICAPPGLTSYQFLSWLQELQEVHGYKIHSHSLPHEPNKCAFL